MVSYRMYNFCLWQTATSLNHVFPEILLRFSEYLENFGTLWEIGRHSLGISGVWAIPVVVGIVVLYEKCV